MRKLPFISKDLYIPFLIVIALTVIGCEKILTKEEKPIVGDWDIMMISKAIYYSGSKVSQVLEFYCEEEGTLSFGEDHFGFFQVDCNPFDYDGSFTWNVNKDTLNLSFEDGEIFLLYNFRFENNLEVLDLLMSLEFESNIELNDTIYHFLLTKNILK